MRQALPDVLVGPGDRVDLLELVVERQVDVVPRAGGDARPQLRLRGVVRRLMAGDRGAGGAVEVATADKRATVQRVVASGDHQHGHVDSLAQGRVRYQLKPS